MESWNFIFAYIGDIFSAPEGTRNLSLQIRNRCSGLITLPTLIQGKS